MAIASDYPGKKRAVSILLKERRRIKRIQKPTTSPIKSLREALATATNIAVLTSASRQWNLAFELACQARGIKATRRDGLPVLRVLRFLGLYSAPSSARRHALAIALLVRSGRSIQKLKRRMREEGPKTIIEMAKPSIIRELTLTSSKPCAGRQRLARIITRH